MPIFSCVKKVHQLLRHLKNSSLSNFALALIFGSLVTMHIDKTISGLSFIWIALSQFSRSASSCMLQCIW